jgi:hypothetical protein
MFTAAIAAASRAYRTLPENVMRVNFSGRNRADCNALPHGLPSHAHNAASARKLARKERIRPNRVCRLLQDLELAASAYSAHFTQDDAKLKGSDVALGTTTRFGTPSLVLAPGAANWT